MLILVLGLIVAHAAAAVAPAYGETMIWKFRSHHPNIVDVQLYASARRNVWPGNGRVWSLNDYTVKQMTISCHAGEKVCYGAWVRGTESAYWGGGRNNRQHCDSCCYLCEERETPVINLNWR
jgi:hypothetical protein